MCAVHTLAAKPCIFTVQTVMHTNSIVSTVYKSSLPAVADQVIKMYGTSPLAKRARERACAPAEIDKISQDYIIATITSRLDWLQTLHMKIEVDKTCNQCLALLSKLSKLNTKYY